MRRNKLEDWIKVKGFTIPKGVNKGAGFYRFWDLDILMETSVKEPRKKNHNRETIRRYVDEVVI